MTNHEHDRHSTPDHHANVTYPDLSELVPALSEPLLGVNANADGEAAPAPPPRKERRSGQLVYRTPNSGGRLTIKEMDADERPREKLIKRGAASLSNAELLAIVLRVGRPGETVVELANRLLVQYGGWPGLMRADFNKLKGEKGLGEVKACELQAALEIGRRLLLAGPGERMQIRNPSDIANWLMLDMAGLEQEHLRVVLLNTKNQMIKMVELYRGSLNKSTVRVAELFKEAVRENAAAIIIAHNHPSGDPEPSTEDIVMTSKAVDAGRLMEVEVLDHLIIGEQRYISMKERRLGFVH
jgi:DNA repair protein RadC